jgi:hypothetical protein
VKIMTILARVKPRRAPAPRPVQVSDWTTRDWADLPPHHPRRD